MEKISAITNWLRATFGTLWVGDWPSRMSGCSDSVCGDGGGLLRRERDVTYHVFPFGGGLEFPERPGALRKFLLGLQSEWNISLWHYRNYGAGSWYLSMHEYGFADF